MDAARLDEPLASRFARIALVNVVREFPNKLDHLMDDAADVRRPSALHPVFYGSFDWHSSVHMHWTLVTLLETFPALPEADAIVARLDAHFTVERIAGELAYLARPSSLSFERPYGWAWLLKLCEGLHRLAAADASSSARAMLWRDRMQPLAAVVVARAEAFLPRVVHPSRAGSHANSAFAATLMLDYATTCGVVSLRDTLVAKVRAWYGDDRDYPVGYETSSEDFLSNGLLEAMLMHRVLCMDADGLPVDCGDAAPATALFTPWWDGLVPDTAALSHWLAPIVPSDRSDARLTHIDGLNLSRAWCWAKLVDALPEALRTLVERAIDAHLHASLPHVADGAYVGTHWLASFALLAFGALGERAIEKSGEYGRLQGAPRRASAAGIGTYSGT